MRVTSAFLATLLVCTAPACGAIWGFEDGTLARDDAGLDRDGSSGAGASGGLADADADADAPLPPTPDTPAPPDCAQRVPDPNAIYVDSFAGGNDSLCAPANPCKSIQHAIELATAGRSTIYLATGRYDESTSIPPAQLGLGLLIEGRWTHDATGWTAFCDDRDNGTEVYGNAEHALEVIAPDVDDGADAGVATPDAGGAFDVELRYLTLHGLPSTGEGTSSYGILAHGTHVVLSYASVIADFGGAGHTPTEQERPVAATGKDTCISKPPGDGAPGESGGPLPKGDYTPAGFAPAGVPSVKASAGHRGVCADTCTAEGGAPGVDAQSGGASIAAYLWDATLDIDANSGLVAFGGGAGGNGGAGGAGADVNCVTSKRSIGGAGGVGSPGAGGPGACIVKNAGSSIPALNQRVCHVPANIAPGGLGGPGVTGLAGDREAIISVAAPEPN